MSGLLDPFLTMESRLRMESGIAVERTLMMGEYAFAGIAFRCGNDGLAATFRIISGGIPTLEKIGEEALPLFETIAQTPRGLVLTTGPAGSGKWTTVCAIADRINQTQGARIFVVESHPNYLFESKEGMVSQIHVGLQSESYERALETALYSDLDVLIVDDIPTQEALRQALILAETGHLVIASLHAESSVEAVTKLIETAGPDGEAFRRSLVRNLVVVLNQRLFRRADRPGRVPAYEWIKPIGPVRDAILSGNMVELAEAQSHDPECRLMADSIKRLVDNGSINKLAL
jgi:twitching motility protein PilT